MNLIKSIKHQIALSVIRRWFLEGGNRFLGKDGRPVAGLNEFSKYLWEVGYRESLGFHPQLSQRHSIHPPAAHPLAGAGHREW
jgi:hypothetical protein